MSLEEVIETFIGRFEKYQIFILLIIKLGRYPTEFQLCNVVFITPSAEYIWLDENAVNASHFCQCSKS